MNKYAEIILPLSLDGTFTYFIPEDISSSIQVGMRVLVNFGSKKIYTGIVYSIHNNPPAYNKIKPISLLLDNCPFVLESQLVLWNFISKYYCCTLGDVYKIAVPSALKIESESSYEIVKSDNVAEIAKDEQIIVDKIQDKNFSTSKLSYSEIKTLKKLIEKGIISEKNSINNPYKPKYITEIKLNDNILNINALNNIIAGIKNCKAQKKCLEYYIEHYVTDDNGDIYGANINIDDLCKASSSSKNIINELIKKDIFLSNTIQVDFTINKSDTITNTNELTPIQEKAYKEIINSFSSKNTTLLYGVTSSGKTEIYIKLIKKYFQLGKQILFIAPDAGIVEQLERKLKPFFGDDLGMFHPYISENSKVSTYLRMLSDNPYKIIIGIKQSIFLPFTNLGLVIIDEEHDINYKQSEISPRYHVRDSSVYLAYIHGAKTLLGSASPSIETYCNTQINKYGLVSLTQRYNNTESPKITLIDTNESYKKRQIRGHFSHYMIKRINETIFNGEQVILFQNRRGFSPFVSCKECNWVPKCPHCDVSLSYHLNQNKLMCHYCGYTITKPDICPNCHTGQIDSKGFGTEQLEQETSLLFPAFKIARMDTDTAGSIKKYTNIVENFQDNQTDILIGTQILSKGLDFYNVGLVCILNADNLLYHPDFRADERAFQLMTQLSGRIGRHFYKKGEMIIQTTQIHNPIFKYLRENNYQQFFHEQMVERKNFDYPPFSRLIKIVLKHTDLQICIDTSIVLSQRLKTVINQNVSDSIEPPIPRMHNKYIRYILIKVDQSAQIFKIKATIKEEIDRLKKEKRYNSTIIQTDVDPY